MISGGRVLVVFFFDNWYCGYAEVNHQRFLNNCIADWLKDFVLRQWNFLRFCVLIDSHNLALLFVP